MIPNGIELAHIEKAIERIEIEGIPNSRKSVHYDFVYKGKSFPPKLVISYASKFAFGEELSSYDFNAVRARDYLRARGYIVNDRRDSERENEIQFETVESNFSEGTEIYKMHRALERDTSIARKVKVMRLKDSGKLECEVCGFDFFQTYGGLGLGYIEAHHTTPVHELKGTRKTQANELALVCSNCHKMLHRGKPLMSISELRKVIEPRKIAV
ncbi:HNH endonuclease [Vibrio parahaemolyticus]|nr:HNH endonuclease [Vibrio parahaemolyticus]EKG2657605.1 HNH endonuclease [Vibrio parahaemolyticus]